MTVSIYACGGCGVNIAKMIKDIDAEINYIDTSVSNLKSVNSPNVFLVEGMDGAGKDRSVAYHNFKDISGDVLLKYKPSEQLNIVISSLSGGSGSILAPMVASKLLEQGRSVIVIGVNSKHSIVELRNTVNTLKTYKATSSNAAKPISMYYIENTSRVEADRQALHFVNLLSLLTDKKVTEEFDNSDLKSFLYYDKVTANEPTLAILEVAPNDATVAQKGTSIVGTILITKNKSSNIQGTTPEYLSTCIVSDPDYNNEDIRLNSVLGKFSIILEDLEKDIQSHVDAKRVNKIKDVDVQTSNSDGVFL